MEVIEAIRSRRAIRSFKPDPVPRKVLEELLETCRWAPSTGNVQPWEFAILGGKVLEEVKARIEKKAEAEWDSANRSFRNIYPDLGTAELPQLYEQRFLNDKAIRDAVQFPPGTERLDEKRVTYLHRGWRFHDAPNAVIIYIERALFPKYLIDIGLIAQTICLAALAYGLGTCIMGTVTYWPDILRELLQIPESKLIVTTIAIGYPDTDAPINTYERQREPFSTFTHWHGV